MVTAQHQVVIKRPADVIFQAVIDLSNWHGWISALTEVRLLSPEPIGEGTAFEQWTRFLGQSLVLHTTITEFLPPERAVFDTTQPFRTRQMWTLEPGDDGTRVTLTVESEPGNFFGPATPMLLNALNRAMRDDMERLKEALETAPA